MKNKHKVRTCGNCAHLQKRDNRKTVIHLRYAVNLWFCPNRWWSWKKPQNIDVCELHEFKTRNDEKEMTKDEIIELAVDVYILTCPDRVFGLCSTVSSRSPLDDNIYGCLGRDCLKVKEFIKKLEKDGK